MANRRQRRSERQSAFTEATAEHWFLQLPDGPCRVAVAHFLDEARRGGASVEDAMAQGLAYATRLFPEKIVLWGLDGALGPVPWQNESFQRGIRWLSESCARSTSIWPGSTTRSWRRCAPFAPLSSRSNRPRPSCPSSAPGASLAPRT